MQNSSTPLESFNGRVEKILFHNPDNGYAVLHMKVRGNRHLVTVVGYILSLSIGETAHISGCWARDRVYGPQFKAQQITRVPPTTAHGLEKYLGSGLIKGIGPGYAKKLVAAFGEKVLEVIEEEPERLRSVAGIGLQRADQIIQGWVENKSIRDIMQFLHQHGISTSRAVRIHKIFGQNAVGIITKDPYKLVRKIKGIGFLSADAIAQKLGISTEDPQRIQAGLLHTLGESVGKGQCGMPMDALFQGAEKILKVPYPLLQEGLNRALAQKDVMLETVDDQELVFLGSIYNAETRIGNLLWRLAQGEVPWTELQGAEAIQKSVQQLEEQRQLTLAPSQKEALKKALAAKVMVITGGPGVGKTTLVNSFLHILKAQKMRIVLCAPTGRAAHRLSESTGHEAKTIHRLLETDPQEGGFRRGPENPLECDVVVVDEMSMVDVHLMASLLEALPSKAALLLVGDKDQLPSVGAGQVLADVIHSGVIPVAHLKEIFRQASSSQIITNAHRVNEGRMPILDAPEDGEKDGADFYFIDSKNPADCIKKLLEVVKNRIPQKWGFDPMTQIQVLCPLNRGSMGTRALNGHLQEVLNPNPSLKIERFGTTFSLGDKVMQVVNNYDKEVYNGDIGRITHIDMRTEELGITFEDREVFYNFGELDEISLAYATTIHKSQGSEHTAVVIPIVSQYFHMLQRNLLYTGLTRGKRLVVLIGERRALGMAVKNSQNQKRWSRLQKILVGLLSKS